ncbi:glycosyltransferase family 4 protein [Ornithinimicrobium sp. LYQ121]|uniref:glycosyltransferase family 4 protein n=1 Tax=Ornithinimicrobium sp. LYQ121 TaxID=3378801 RepID=UPI003851C721
MTAPPGGDRIILAVTSSQSLRLLRGFPEYLAARGWDVHVVCADAPGSAEGSYTLHSLPMHRQPSIFQDAFALLRWVVLMARLRPSVVVAGTPKAGLLGMVASFVTARPTRIYLLRGLRLTTESGSRRRLLRVLEKTAVRMATKTQIVSHSLAREAVAMKISDLESIVVVGPGSSNGVAIPPLAEAEIPPGERRAQLGLVERPTIGFVGRITADKGIETLVRAYSMLKRTGATVHLLIIGPEEVPGYLKTLIVQEGLHPEDVTWVGSVSEPAPYYRAMEVLCLPSRREGFPNVILEAAAHGVPTVASRVTGCVDAVVEHTTGLLFSVDDTKDLAHALGTFIHEQSLQRRMGRNARERAVQEFSREHIWRLTEEFYRREVVLGQDSRRRNRSLWNCSETQGAAP